MEKANRNIAIVLLGGSGERFDPSTPKQFVRFDNVPLFLYPVLSLENSPLIEQILIVTKIGTIKIAESLLREFGVKKVMGVIEGGDNRQESSRRGLEFLKENGVNDDDIVLIQDGDRPNLTDYLIEESIDKAKEIGASIVAFPSTDSVFLAFKTKKKVDTYLDRNYLYRVQTPQTFRFHLIYEAHQKLKGESHTDDASLVKECGFDVAIVKGSEENLKINTQEDGRKFLLILERREGK
ncbi:MAG: 2-C-methyl-D-erythritol 4-phosphate cytidylyltransferase [Bacilli bacterium]|nr:2-C-methyl-D-erythritol 4-phosphate cytidylyltransferase [Bacilli bacterium]